MVRDPERAGAEAERTRTGLGGGNGPQLSDRTVASDHDEAFSGPARSNRESGRPVGSSCGLTVLMSVGRALVPADRR